MWLRKQEWVRLDTREGAVFNGNMECSSVTTGRQAG